MSSLIFLPSNKAITPKFRPIPVRIPPAKHQRYCKNHTPSADFQRAKHAKIPHATTRLHRGFCYFIPFMENTKFK